MALPPFMIGENRFYLSQLVDQATIGIDDPTTKETYRSAGMSPSSASAEIVDPISGLPMVIGTCLRQAYFRTIAAGQSEPPSAKGVRIMAMGDLLSNNFVYDKAKIAGIWAGDEVRFYDAETKTSGRCDLIIKLMDGSRMGVEIKSFGGFKTTPFIKAGDLGYQYLEPRYKDLPQTMTYMAHWAPRGIRYWALYYITRDGDTNEFVLEWANVEPNTRPHDEAYLQVHSTQRTWSLPWLTWGAVKKRYALLLDYLNKKQVPPRDFNLLYSNTELLAFAANEEGGNQLTTIGKMDSKVIRKNHNMEVSRTGIKDPEAHNRYLEKGDINCAYCSWKSLCWTGISPAGTEELPAAKSIEELRKNKPKAAVADKIEPEIEL